MKLGNKISLIIWIIAISGMIHWYLDGMPDKSKFGIRKIQKGRVETTQSLSN